MNSQHVLPIQLESFALLVAYLKNHINEADVFEIWLDEMKVKGDLAVIQKYFKKPMIAKSNSLEMLKQGIKAGLTFVDVPYDMDTDAAFETLVKNKGTQVIRSYHNHLKTPSYDELLAILETMIAKKAHLFKIATYLERPEDAATLLRLMDETHLKEKLIITGMGKHAREIRIMAPLKGSVFYYAPLDPQFATAPGQMTREELEKEWDLLGNSF